MRAYTIELTDDQAAQLLIYAAGNPEMIPSTIEHAVKYYLDSMRGGYARESFNPALSLHGGHGARLLPGQKRHN